MNFKVSKLKWIEIIHETKYYGFGLIHNWSMEIFGQKQDELFKLLNMVVLPAWILLVIAPRTKFTKNIVIFTAISVCFAFIFFELMSITNTTSVNNMKETITMIKSFTLAGLQQKISDMNFYDIMKPFFFSDLGFLIIWSHYIIIDLLLGYYITKDAFTSNIPHLFISPCLFLTLMAAPIGFLSYMLMKNFYHYILRK
jgi:hypothetical protein